MTPLVERVGTRETPWSPARPINHVSAAVSIHLDTSVSIPVWIRRLLCDHSQVRFRSAEISRGEGGKVGAGEGHRCFSGGVICMQAASSSHRYASQLTSIGVGQSGNPILSAKTGRNREGSACSAASMGSCAPVPLHLTGATSNARLLSVISQ